VLAQLGVGVDDQDQLVGHEAAPEEAGHAGADQLDPAPGVGAHDDRDAEPRLVEAGSVRVQSQIGPLHGRRGDRHGVRLRAEEGVSFADRRTGARNEGTKKAAARLQGGDSRAREREGGRPAAGG
jgi:hypothetical protein